MFNLMLHLSKFKNAGMICDRSHLGEMVYGPIYRNYTGEYVLDIEAVYNVMKTFWDNVILITLVDKPERLIERDDGLSFSIDVDKKTTEINNFKNAHDKSTIKHKYIIDIETFDADAVKQIATEYIEKCLKGNDND